MSRLSAHVSLSLSFHVICTRISNAPPKPLLSQAPRSPLILHLRSCHLTLYESRDSLHPRCCCVTLWAIPYSCLPACLPVFLPRRRRTFSYPNNNTNNNNPAGHRTAGVEVQRDKYVYCTTHSKMLCVVYGAQSFSQSDAEHVRAPPSIEIPTTSHPSTGTQRIYYTPEWVSELAESPCHRSMSGHCPPPPHHHSILYYFVIWLAGWLVVHRHIQSMALLLVWAEL